MLKPASSRQERNLLRQHDDATTVDTALAKGCSSRAMESDSAESAALALGAGEHIGVEMGRALSICASLLLVAAPFQAASAQEQDERNVSVNERQHRDYNPLGLRLGGFDLNASVEFAAVHTDNLYADEINERDDTFFEVSPEMRLRSHWSRHQLEASAGAAFSQYQDFSSEDSNSYYFGVGGRYDIGRATAVGANLNYTHGTESRTDPDAAVGIEPVEYDITTASGYVSHEFNRLRLRGTISQTEFDYQNTAGTPIVQDTRDSTISAISGRAEYVINPRISLLGQVTADEREYDAATSPDSNGLILLAGVKLELTNLLRGEFSVGQFERDYDGAGTIDGVAVDGTINWFATPLTTVTFTAGRNVQDSSILTPYVNTRWGVRADHELLRNVTLYAGVASQNHEYDDTVLDREDEIRIYDVGARYLMNRRVSFSASYAHNDTTSEGADRYRDFEENRTRLGVRFAL
jgi:hypothetical protein